MPEYEFRTRPDSGAAPVPRHARPSSFSTLAALLVLLLVHVANAAEPVILVLGDSLSAGYGVPLGKGWVHLLDERLRSGRRGYRVVNASISGDTTRGGLARIGNALDTYRPTILVLELGGNDGLRGVPLAETRRNLKGIIKVSQAAGARVLLVGIQLPPNYGPAYTERFKAIYPELAERHDVPLVPFLLEGVATDPALMQADGIHPRKEAQNRLLDNIWPYLEPML
jgi:acyl-CoA thioesterase-1